MNAAQIEAEASALFDRLYNAFGRRLWPLIAINGAAAAFFDMVFKSTLLQLHRDDGAIAFEEGRTAVLGILDRLRHEIATATPAALETGRSLWEGCAQNIPKPVDVDELTHALEESLRLQTHYASLLNAHDGGRRIGFKDVDAWFARLRETGTLPKR